jgi:uncharacterized protein (DUF58 family)
VAAGSSQGRIWVLPNRQTTGLAAVLVAMWYAGASQNNGAAYLLCFVLCGVAIVSTVHTWANLRGVAISAEPITPVFAGDEIIVPLAVSSARRRSHFDIQIFARRGKVPAQFAEVTSSGPEHREVRFAAVQRGCFHTLPLRIVSQFPLGFLSAHQHVILAQTYYVYPAPRGTVPLPRALASARQPRDGTRIDGDDFGGVRAWRPGESQRHIDWKAAARGQPLLTKQWTGEADDILRLAWDALPLLEMETRLSQLACWILHAERGADRYELQLPHETIPAGRGQLHLHRCLRALALFSAEEMEDAQ